MKTHPFLIGAFVLFGGVIAYRYSKALQSSKNKSVAAFSTVQGGMWTENEDDPWGIEEFDPTAVAQRPSQILTALPYNAEATTQRGSAAPFGPLENQPESNEWMGVSSLNGFGGIGSF